MCFNDLLIPSSQFTSRLGLHSASRTMLVDDPLHCTNFSDSADFCNFESAILFKLVIVKCVQTVSLRNLFGNFDQISKRFDDFEAFSKGLASEFPGTVFPPIQRSILPSFFDKNVSEKKEELEIFLNFIASTPRICTSYLTLEFLGMTNYLFPNIYFYM